ncbi:MAG: hypothetical protein H6742_18095 [Alphaproteobacteria bacterium]|nr:hypothetical protein [Alphaproteobacteria bacterium]
MSLLALLLAVSPAQASPTCCSDGIGYHPRTEPLFVVGLDRQAVLDTFAPVSDVVRDAMFAARPDHVYTSLTLFLQVGPDGGVDRIFGDWRAPADVRPLLYDLQFPEPADGVALVDVVLKWRNPDADAIIARQKQARLDARSEAEAVPDAAADAAATDAAATDAAGEAAAAPPTVPVGDRPAAPVLWETDGGRPGYSAPAVTFGQLAPPGRYREDCATSERDIPAGHHVRDRILVDHCAERLGRLLAPVVADLLACDPVGRPGGTVWRVSHNGVFLQQAQEQDDAVLKCMDDVLMGVDRSDLRGPHALTLFWGPWLRPPATDPTGKRLR